MSAEPWQTAEIPGPKKALVITKPEVVVAMLRRARRPLLILGHEAAEVEVEGGKKMIDFAIELAEAANLPIVATGHVKAELLKRGFTSASSMLAVEIAQRLQDPGWEGLDGKGPYDLVLVMGLPYYLGWLILSGLKHFSSVKTISVDRYYQPHASWSFPNLSMKDWSENLKVIISKVREVC